MNRSAQGFGLPLGTGTGTSVALSGVLNRDSMLQDLILEAGDLGLVTVIKVGGQSVMASNKGACLSMFAASAKVEGQRSLALPMKARQTVDITAEPTTSAIVIGHIHTDPVHQGYIVPDINDMGERLAYVAGLGAVDVAQNTATSLTCTMTKRGTLGRLVLDWEANPLEGQVRSVLVNGLELLAGRSTDYAPIGAFGPDCSDQDGGVLAYPVEINHQVEIGLYNVNATAAMAYGGIFMMPSIQQAA